ncbi:uncharacterized protein LOC133311081 [Gastrolobium bilobum]|uniref:uncharacterized protein LOC133311081 n=1 Tax=Gastrolobium bilobum TaxID=150636 RepID=UPI002AAF7883|nr:uncharacterized protein LOC133311081 [Gastrolobium bilobum]
MEADAKEHVKRYEQCQKHALILHALLEELQTITAPWPFYKWGMDLTSAQTSIEETPFKLTYGCEAMIPVEIGEPSWRRVQRLQGTEEKNSEGLAVELDLLDESRENARYRNMMAKRLVTTRFNKKVRPRSFQNGDLVLRRADIDNKNARDGKLTVNWEGPYRVKENLGRGAYTLETISKKSVKRSWNANKLKAYYR